MKGFIKRLLREELINEMDMKSYFNMVTAELKTHIKKLNTIYDNFNDYTIMSMININHNDIRNLHNSFDAAVDNIYSMMSKYDDKMDSLDWNAYREERSYIDKMTNLIKPKENMLSDIFYKLGALSDIKDDYENNPFGDIKTMNIG